MRVDAHQHFWRFSAEQYPWMSADMRVLRRDWLPEHLRPLLESASIDACIGVQARASEVETDFLLDLAESSPWIGAVVGWVDLCAADVEQRIARWSSREKLAGFRHQLQDEPGVREFVSDARFQRGIATLQKSELVYEVLVYSRQLEAVVDLCRLHDTHWLVLDHLGKPPIRRGSYAEWRRAFTSLASLPHVVCKLSGLVTEAVDAAGRFEERELDRYLDGALDLFGAERLMFGSDWPVCLLAASHEQVVSIIAHWSESLSTAERAAIWGETARKVYDL
jgi:L-fuconolactonase